MRSDLLGVNVTIVFEFGIRLKIRMKFWVGRGVGVRDNGCYVLGIATGIWSVFYSGQSRLKSDARLMVQAHFGVLLHRIHVAIVVLKDLKKA